MRLEPLTLRAAPVFCFLVAVVFPFGSSMGMLRQPGGALRWAILLVAAAVGFTLLALRRVPLRPVHVLWAAFAAYAALSALWSLAPRTSVLHALTIVVLLGAVFLALWPAASTADGPPRMAQGFLAGILVVEAISIVYALVDPGGGRQPDPAHRFRGIFENANELAIYGELAVPLSVAAALRTHGRTRLAWLAAAAASLVVIVLTGTRAGVPIAIVASLVVLSVAGLHRTAAIAAIVAAAVIVVAVAAILSGGLGLHLLRTNTVSSLGGRTEAWARATEAIGRRPVGGYGFATEQQLLAPYKRYHLLLREGKISQIPPAYRKTTFLHFTGGFVESSYIGAGAQLGFIGIAFLVAQLLLPLAGLAEARGRADPAMTGLFAAGLCIGAFESVLWSVGSIVAVPFWTAALCLVRAPALAPQPAVDALRAQPASTSAARP